MKASESLQNDQSTATENALRRAVDTTPAFIHTARPDGYLDYFNRGWLDFLGKSLEEVCGWRWTESVHPEDVAEIVQKWHAALASGEPFEIEARVRRADGSYRALLHRKLPLRDEHGNIVKWFGSSIDIEDRKCAEEGLQRRRRNWSEANFICERENGLLRWEVGLSGRTEFLIIGPLKCFRFSVSIPVMASPLLRNG